MTEPKNAGAAAADPVTRPVPKTDPTDPADRRYASAIAERIAAKSEAERVEDERHTQELARIASEFKDVSAPAEQRAAKVEAERVEDDRHNQERARIAADFRDVNAEPEPDLTALTGEQQNRYEVLTGKRLHQPPPEPPPPLAKSGAEKPATHGPGPR